MKLLSERLKKELQDLNIDKEAKRVREDLELGKQIRAIAKQKRLSIRDIADRIGGSVSQVQRLMKGENVNIDTLAKFSVAVGKRLQVEIK